MRKGDVIHQKTRDELIDASYSLLAETDDFIVIDKHAGISFHSEGNHQGLVETVRSDLHYDLWPVHRLDKATSGLLMLAKNKEACRDLCQLFAQRQVQKFYFAMSDCPKKKLKKKQGSIVGDMERTRNGNWKLVQTKNNPAITQFFSYSMGPKQRLFILKPHTGKTHQLRVALKSIGAPIIGDTRYGAKQAAADRMYLHAYQLHFTFNNVDYTYESLPKDADFSLVAEFIDSQSIHAKILPWPTL